MPSLDELDKLAAEKIMGWKIIERPNFSNCFDDGTLNKIPCWSWFPTRNIDQAFELLEKMNHAWQIKSLPFTNSYICCVMTIDINIFGQAGTVPLAITLACLKARGVNCD